MDPLTLGAEVVPLLGLYLAQAGERAAQQLGEKVGSAAAAKLARLYEVVKARVAGVPEASAALRQLERHPDDPRRRERLAGELEDLAAADPDLAEELRRLVDGARREGGLALTQIIDAGAVTIHGNIIQRGTLNAGRDIKLG